MARRVPPGLGAKGRRLWREIAQVRPELGPGEAIEVEECCRIVDRLDRLHEAISSGEYLRALADPQMSSTQTIKIVVNAPLGEARQQAMTLRALLTSLGLEKAVGSALPAPTDTGKGDPADELAAERERRRNAATTTG